MKAKGEKAVKDWINKDWINAEMKYKRAVVVLVGSQTASRKFVKYEIERVWN